MLVEDKLIGKFIFMLDYLKEIDYELSEQLSRFAQNGIGKPEVLLESAVKISYNRAYSSCAMLLVKAYEHYMFETEGYCFPYLVNSVRELISRNMVEKETNDLNKCLYLIEMSNGTIKIGIAKDVERRISQIKSASGMDIKKCLYTSTFENAQKYENKLHKKYKDDRKNGEYFSTSFCTVEKDFVKIAREKNVELHYMLIAA
jgi:predicted GIY-YIG superfamily endonuclease